LRVGCWSLIRPIRPIRPIPSPLPDIPPTGQIATRIPLSGQIGNPDADIFATIGSLLRNAYIQALFPSFDGYLGRPSTANANITTNQPP